MSKCETGPTILALGRRLQAAWIEQERLELLARDYRQREQDSHTRDALYQLDKCSKTNNEAQFAIEHLISTTQGKDAFRGSGSDHAGLCSHRHIARGSQRGERGGRACRRLAAHAAVGTAGQAREAGIDLADFGGDYYASSPYCPWPTGELAAAE